MCLYRFKDQSQCQLEDVGKGFCFWHDPTIDKAGKPLAKDLERVVRNGHKMEGAYLERANLEGLNLVCHGQNKGFSLARADLYRANLKNAHLFHIDLSEASLMKADCREANLHFADCRRANLLGAKFDGAKIENIDWGEQLLHEEKGLDAYKRGDKEKAYDFFEQAEEICRNLRKVSEHQGLFELAGYFFYEEMIMRRFQMPRLSLQWSVSKLVDIFCGYGERPARVIAFSLAFILFWAVMYFFFGISDGGQFTGFNASATLSENISAFLKTLYFSVVTFTTLGYGDLVPIGPSRVIAAMEAFTGSFTLALFVVVFVKKMTR